MRVDAKLYPSERVLHALGAHSSAEILDKGARVAFEVSPDIDTAQYADKAAEITSADLVAYAAAKRYAVETGGIVVDGDTIATDRDSQAMIGNAFAYVTASGAVSVRFKAASGWVTLSAGAVKQLALAVGAHVQAAFAVEAEIDAAISASPPTITTTDQIDAAAWPATA